MADTTTTNYSFVKPEPGSSENTWGDKLNQNWDDLDTLLGGVSQTEFAILDGATVTTAELNLLDGVTWTLTNYNTLTSTAAELNLLDGVTWTLTDYNTLTSTAAELNLLDGITALTGADTQIVTGTAGSDGDIVQWNADGDLVSYGAATQAEADWETGTSTTESLVSPAKVKAAVEALAGGTEAGPTTVSGTEVDFTSIPSGVNEIVATFNAVQFGTNNYIAARLGTSAGVATTGYESVMLGLNQVGSPLADAQSTYVVTRAGVNNSATGNVSGVMRFIREPGGNVWVFEHNLHTYQSNTAHNQSTGSGRVTLPGTLDRVRFFGDNGGSFSSGKIALRYF